MAAEDTSREFQPGVVIALVVGLSGSNADFSRLAAILFTLAVLRGGHIVYLCCARVQPGGKREAEQASGAGFCNGLGGCAVGMGLGMRVLVLEGDSWCPCLLPAAGDEHFIAC